MNGCFFPLCLSSGGDDCSSLSRLPLRPHRVLGLLPVLRLPGGRIWGRPPPSCPRRGSRLTSEVQGGAERRNPQKEGEESRVGRWSQSAGDCTVMASAWWDFPFLSDERGILIVLPNETLSSRAKWCSLHFPQDEDSVNTPQVFQTYDTTWTFLSYLFLVFLHTSARTQILARVRAARASFPHL